MVEQKKPDAWSVEDYQASASFVPKLAGKVLEWLDVQPDDKILDVGCGDGVLTVQIAQVLAQGTGSIHGIDSSPAMIDAASKLASGLSNCTFEVLDATEIPSAPHLQSGGFTKVFSNAALHWILRHPVPLSDRRSGAAVFGALRAAIAPGGRLVFEMGGLGNVAEMRTALAGAVTRRVGIERAVAADPWFFPDEEWTDAALREAGGWVVERIEREWRPTPADRGGVEGWIRLMGSQFLDALDGREGEGEGKTKVGTGAQREMERLAEREACVREAADLLRHVCRAPGGGEVMGYVRLRCDARRMG